MLCSRQDPLMQQSLFIKDFKERKTININHQPRVEDSAKRRWYHVKNQDLCGLCDVESPKSTPQTYWFSDVLYLNSAHVHPVSVTPKNQSMEFSIKHVKTNQHWVWTHFEMLDALGFVESNHCRKRVQFGRDEWIKLLETSNNHG